MKSLIIVTLLSICFNTFLQSWHIENFKAFNTYFQKVEKGNFDGYADGSLLFDFTDGTKSRCSFSKNSAQLNIVPDTNKVYDVSFRNYNATNGNISIQYSTYNLANALNVQINHKKYNLNFIDDACRHVIKGLNYNYIQEERKEILKINFSERVGLYEEKKYLSKEFYVPAIFVEKGSNLTFTINKN